MGVHQVAEHREGFLPQTAVFIDGDWLIHAARRLEKRLDFRRLQTIIQEYLGRRTLVRIYFSLDVQDTENKRFIESLKKLGYAVQTKPVGLHGAIKYRRGLDAVLTTDAASLPLKFDRIVLLSGDSDFVPLLRFLKKSGRTTVLVAFPLITSKELKANADYFANIEELLEEPEETRQEPRAGEVRAPESFILEEAYIERGQHLEAYLLFRRLFTSAKKCITIIDPYIDHQILLMVPLLDPSISVQILSDRIQSPDFCNMVQKLRLEGHIINVYRTKEFHDRYIEVDSEWYHSGHSFKALGSKDSRMSSIRTQTFLEKLYKRKQSAITNASVLCP